MSTMPAPSASPDLAVLLDLFYESPAAAGQFVEVSADELPPVYRRLLAHEEHMTVTVEEHHGSKVDVEVLESQMVDSHYARKIRLRRQSDGQGESEEVRDGPIVRDDEHDPVGPRRDRPRDRPRRDRLSRLEGGVLPRIAHVGEDGRDRLRAPGGGVLQLEQLDVGGVRNRRGDDDGPVVGPGGLDEQLAVGEAFVLDGRERLVECGRQRRRQFL